MDNSIENDSIEHDSIDIRQPDQVIKETLIDDTDEAYLYNEEINRTINVSIMELKHIEDLEELELLRLITEEKETIMLQFSTIKDKINKMYTIDKINSHVYESILSYIELRVSGYILYQELDKITYNKIMSCINRIRFTAEEKQSLANLLQVKE